MLCLLLHQRAGHGVVTCPATCPSMARPARASSSCPAGESAVLQSREELTDEQTSKRASDSKNE